MGHLETALANPRSAGEGPFLMAEEFTFDKRFRQSSAIYFHERHGGSVGTVMDGMGDTLLAHTALAENQYRSVGFAHLFDEGINTLHDFRIAHNRFGPVSILQLVLKAPVFLPHLFEFFLSVLAQTDSLGNARCNDGQKTSVVL